MKAAILTMFTGLSPTYSLVNVVEEQIRMLLDAGIGVRVLVSETCPDRERTGVFRDPAVEWVRVTNTLHGAPIRWYDYSGTSGRVHDTFFEEADRIAEDFVRALQGVDVCLMHDILYQGWHLVHNVAIRRAQTRLPGVRFLEFTHSLPIQPPAVPPAWPFSARFSPMPATRFVYPTVSGLPALARQYGVPLSACAAVPNSLSLIPTLGADARRVASRIDLETPEVLCVCPARLTPGKQLEKAAALAGTLRALSGQPAALVFCDFPCADISPAVYKSRIRSEGRRCGLQPGELLFTSDIGYPDGFPRAGVLELFGLSNLFLCPSRSESFGLTVLEAAARGNLLVVNQAVPALEELGGALGAIFMRWDARNFDCDTHETYHPSERLYREEHAREILRRLREDPVLRARTLARTRYSSRAVFREYLLPLLTGGE